MGWDIYIIAAHYSSWEHKCVTPFARWNEAIPVLCCIAVTVVAVLGTVQHVQTRRNQVPCLACVRADYLTSPSMVLASLWLCWSPPPSPAKT